MEGAAEELGSAGAAHAGLPANTPSLTTRPFRADNQHVPPPADTCLTAETQAFSAEQQEQLAEQAQALRSPPSQSQPPPPGMAQPLPAPQPLIPSLAALPPNNPPRVRRRR